MENTAIAEKKGEKVKCNGNIKSRLYIYLLNGGGSEAMHLYE